MQFLSKFKKEEFQIISEDKVFVSVQNYLQNELMRIEHGNAEFISLTQLDAELEDTIQKYEVKPI